MLEIRNLHARVDDKEILNGIDLTIAPGEIHAIMGPNGSGKSTLAQVLAGNEAFEVTEGQVLYRGDDLLELAPDERAREGVFMAFQYPVEIPGISVAQFLRTALNALREHRGESPLDAMDFLSLARERLELFELDKEWLQRPLNVGFSGGEKKRNEGLQMSLLEPTLAIMDETDSGLDIDALKIVARGVNALRGDERSFLIITHYQRLLEYIVPDCVHVLAGGRIVRSGGKELAEELERTGYAWVDEAVQLEDAS